MAPPRRPYPPLLRRPRCLAFPDLQHCYSFMVSLLLHLALARCVLWNQFLRVHTAILTTNDCGGVPVKCSESSPCSVSKTRIARWSLFFQSFMPCCLQPVLIVDQVCRLYLTFSDTCAVLHKPRFICVTAANFMCRIKDNRVLVTWSPQGMANWAVGNFISFVLFTNYQLSWLSCCATDIIQFYFLFSAWKVFVKMSKRIFLCEFQF
jgi:hypothetical protein